MKTNNTQTASSRPRRTLALAAATVVLGLCGVTSAQVESTNDGGALDANNRIGSGGSNRAGVAPNPNRRSGIGNNIVDGNVSGGAAFRGFVPYRAPTDFRDFTAGFSSSRFAGNSAGVTTSGQLINNASSIHSYYGPSQTVSAPRDFVRAPGTGGYVPPRYIEGGASRIEGRVDEGVETEREIDPLAGQNLNDARGPSVGPLGRPPVGSTTSGPQSLLLSNQYDYERYTANAGVSLSPFTRLRQTSDAAMMDAQDVRRLREELLRDSEGNRLAPGQLDALISGAAPGVSDRQSPGQSPGQAPGQIQPGQTADLTRNPVELEGVDTMPRLQLAGPAEQSALFAQLQERLHRFDPQDPSMRPRLDEEAQANRRLPGLPNLPTQLGGEPADDEEPTPQDVGPIDPPVEIQSLATGISSPTLREALEQAEQLLREERYVSAIARYDAAERLVPNQPLVTLGRATAELGAGYYKRSALNLRTAFARSPELMMARLDLGQLLGEERLREIAATLRERAVEDREDDTPLFLLAFLAYNAGSYEQAGAFLDLANRRSEDPFYDEVARHWALTPAGEAGNGPTTRPGGAGGADAPTTAPVDLEMNK